jgi:hypothetical protein
MEFLTAEEIAKILRTSVWFVYQHRQLFGGIKIGKVVRFDKEIFENKVKEVMQNVSVPPPGEMEIRLLESECPPPRRRISHEAGGESGGSRSPKKSKADEFGLHEIMRQSPKGT